MELKAMNNYELCNALSLELDLPDLENVIVVGFMPGNKKFRFNYGSVMGDRSSRRFTISKNVIKQIREKIKRGEYFINYLEGTSRCIVHIPVNGAKFRNIHDDFCNVIVTTHGSLFDCIENEWYKSVAEFVRGNKKS